VNSDDASFSLATRPWIEVTDLSGQPRTLSAAAVLEQADQVHLAAADPLLWAATVRLLTALAYTAGCGPADSRAYQRHITDSINVTPAAGWVREHAADLDIFATDHPLFQDAELHALAGVPGAALPVLYLDMTAAIGRPLLSDHRHLHASVPVTARRAAELLLIQQTWAVGGRISAKDAVYGPGCNFGRPSAINGGLVWLPAGTVAESLAWRLTPVADGPGAGRWTYTPRVHGTADFLPDSETDALTWMPRRMLLLPEDETGTVARVLFAQGWRMTKQPDLPASTRHGSRELVDSESAKMLSAEAVTSESDLAPLLERWWAAPEGSWAHAARQVIEATGRAPDLVTVGLATNKKKILHQRRISIPAALLADPRSAAAATAVTAFRRRAARAAPSRRRVAATGTTLPPGFGSDLLAQETFLTASDPQREQQLYGLARPAPGGNQALHGERTAAFTAAVLTETDDELFTTAETLYVPPTGDIDGGGAEGAADPGHVLAVNLGRWSASSRMRGVMPDLARWAVQPDLGNSAYPLVTQGLPAEQHHAAMLTAALFAVHYRTNRSGRRYGGADLPRLMRAFGSSGRFGPGHPGTRIALDLIVRTQDPQALRVQLLRQIRFAATQNMAPHWGRLFTDLADWTPEVRQRWAELFYTTAPVPPRPGTGNLPTTHQDKDPISA